MQITNAIGLIDPTKFAFSRLLKRANPNTDTLDMFRAVTRYFMPPEADENINIISA